MKIGIVGDIHWCQYSSIVRKRGNKYSTRLENCIKSINWAENLIKELNCDFTVYLGDFFDKPDLNSEEISALKEIKWNDLHKYFLVGNHETSSNDLFLNSTKIFSLFDYVKTNNNLFSVIDRPILLEGDINTSIFLLPYILEENRQSLNNYFDFQENNNTKILFMHNDIKNIQLGSFISQQGFAIEEIENLFNICINGHLHNRGYVSDKIYNAGNLTGQNFSEDAKKYNHCLTILDTDTLTLKTYENPNALNFYKEDWSETITQNFNFKSNSVITVQTSEQTYEQAKSLIEQSPQIIESRILLKPTLIESESNFEDLSIDHYKSFREYVLSNIDASTLAQEEIEIILT